MCLNSGIEIAHAILRFCVHCWLDVAKVMFVRVKVTSENLPPLQAVDAVRRYRTTPDRLYQGVELA